MRRGAIIGQQENGGMTITDEHKFVARGGSYNLDPVHTRAAARVSFAPHKTHRQLGFRVARTVVEAADQTAMAND